MSCQWRFRPQMLGWGLQQTVLCKMLHLFCFSAEWLNKGELKQSNLTLYSYIYTQYLFPSFRTYNITVTCSNVVMHWIRVVNTYICKEHYQRRLERERESTNFSKISYFFRRNILLTCYTEVLEDCTEAACPPPQSGLEWGSCQTWSSAPWHQSWLLKLRAVPPT